MLRFLVTTAFLLAACMQVVEPRSTHHHHHRPDNCQEIPMYDEVDVSNIEGVFVFMRHGIRAPWTTYPLDPSANDTSRWPNGRSQLTEFGSHQAQAIGQILRTRYGKFSNNLKRNQIYLRASAAMRCIDTINLVADQMWLNTTHITEPFVYSMPKSVDSVLWEEPDCPGADDEETANMKRPAVGKYESQPEIADLYRFVSEKTGLPATISGVDKAFDCVRCEKINGYSSPDWATDEVYEKMGDVYTKHLNFLYSSVRSRRMRAGPMLEEIIEHADKITQAKGAEKETIPRVRIYTTHDYKISALLLSMGEKLNKYPPFAATLIFEIRRNEMHNDYELHVFYISDTVKQPYTIEKLNMAQCFGPNNYRCSLDSFKSSVKEYLGVKWTNECRLKNFNAIEAAEESIGSS